MGIDPPLVLDVSGFGAAIRTGLTDSERHVVEDAFTPTRNLLFITLAAAVGYQKGARNIVMGFLTEESAIFPDQTENFLKVAESAVSAALGTEFRITCPLRDFRKSEVVALAGNLGVTSYYSCHAGGPLPCGVCIACREYEQEDR
jgi:7-cyano-7-deazaguanine synthase